MFSWRSFILGIVLCVGLSPAFASQHGDDRSDYDDDGDDQVCGQSAPCPGSSRFLDLRITDFRSSGRDAPNAARVFLGTTEIYPTSGVYRVPLVQNGAWLRDGAFDSRHIRRNNVPPGVYVIARNGQGGVLHGLFGYLRKGMVYMKAEATLVGARVSKLRNWKRDRFERQGDGTAVPMRAGQDEYKLDQGVLTVQATVTSRADLVLEELRCEDFCAGVTCQAQDNCHEAGVCDPGTGQCSNPEKANGTSCSDGNACTNGDTCQAGVCTAGAVTPCAPGSQCQEEGVCDPASGACVYANKPTGTACDDANACTQVDRCDAGQCVGSQPIVCTALSQCHEAGECLPETGECTTPAKVDGTSCNDDDACTTIDACQDGLCVGGSPLDCSSFPVAQCNDAVCDSALGVCQAKAVTNESLTSCDDGNACTAGDVCVDGGCASGAPLSGPVPGCGNGLACFAGVCADVDECTSGTANCGASSTCTNTTPGYTCACNAGYAGDSTGRNCVALDLCLSDNGGCSADALCASTGPGARTCTCKPGFRGDGVRCDDIDECASPSGSITHGGATGPLAYWPLDEQSGSANDASGNGHHGAPEGSPEYGQPSLLPSGYGSSVRLRNGARFVVPAFEKYSTGSSGYTMEYWIKINGSPRSYFTQIFGDGVSGGEFYMMQYLESSAGGACPRPHYGANNGNWDPSPCTVGAYLSFDVAHHVAVTWDRPSGTVKIYIDGVQYTQTNKPTGVPTQTALPLFIGHDNRETWVDMNLQEVAFWDRAITADEVASRVNGGCAQVCNNTQGGYSCSCNPGYTLGSDGVTCTASDRCADAGGRSRNGQCYVYVAPTCTAGGNTACTNAYEAEAACAASYGGHLASIHTAEENTFVGQVVDPTGRGLITAWIGAISSTNGFCGTTSGGWTDGSAWTFSAWRTNTGEPNSGCTSQPVCVQLFPDNAANRSLFGVCPGGNCTGWNDVGCAENVDYGYVCQFAL